MIKRCIKKCRFNKNGICRNKNISSFYSYFDYVTCPYNQSEHIRGFKIV